MVVIKKICGFENCHREYNSNRNIKYGCGGCQSCKDKKKSINVLYKHVFGKFCKESNICAWCCRTKYIVRFFKHFGGTCNKSRRCEWCNFLQIYNQDFETRSPRFVKELYALMLTKNDFGQFGLKK